MDKLTDYQVIQRLKKKHHFFFKKKLGQNFLLDHQVLEETLSGAEIGKNDVVVEIGPGFGTLTQALSEWAGQVIAIELDEKLRPVHEDTLAGLHNVTVVYGDALKMNIDELVRQFCPDQSAQPYKVVANLPYYITTPILFHLLESGYRLDSITVMVQKEVAQRMQANPGGKEYGALSVGVQFRTIPQILMTVKPGSFFPPPKVESAVIRLQLLPTPSVTVQDESMFFRVVKGAFGQRRKTLLNALGNHFGEFDRQQMRVWLEEENIDPGRRGETLALAEFAKIADRFTWEKGKEDKKDCGIEKDAMNNIDKEGYIK